MLSYVLITPARNEEAFIETVIKSVMAQTVQPKKWVIVSDGSTDRTDDIIQKYAAIHEGIEYARMPEHRERNFAAKVVSFNAGYERVKELEYDVIANLDADISFDEKYFEFLLKKFEQTPNLGVAGTPFVEDGYSTLSDSYEGSEHVAGGCQLFRRKCFEDIGGYPMIKGGSVDKVAVVTARMRGWKTRSFAEKTFFHYRKLGTGGNNRWMAMFKYGERDYRMGRHPLWEFFRVVYRMKKKPFIIGGAHLAAGYAWALVKREERPVSDEFVAFVQREQMRRLRELFGGIVKHGKINRYTE